MLNSGSLSIDNEKEAENDKKMLENLDYTNSVFPLRQYLIVCAVAYDISHSSVFYNLILICIMIAAILVGLETYPALDDSTTIYIIDEIVLSMFALEVVLKVMSEGRDPFRYFNGPEWKWNCFDFLIVFFSLVPLSTKGSSVAILRLIRLMRLAKFFQNIAPLRMIMAGLVGGLKSISYIVLLLFLILYIYAIAGIYFFRGNDPWHWRSIEISMMTLLGYATLSNWGDIMYTNYYGCDKYQMGIYTNDPSEDEGRLGGMIYCSSPNAAPWVSSAYAVSFIFITSFCMLALFIGAVTMSMAEGIEQMKKEKELLGKNRQFQRVDTLKAYNPYMSTSYLRHTRRQMILAYSGQPIEREKEELPNKHEMFFPLFSYNYVLLARACNRLVQNIYFRNFITICIIFSSIEIGIIADGSLPTSSQDILDTCSYVVQCIFASECGLKMISEELTPWTYFLDGWNIFDFCIVVGAFFDASGNLVLMLRLLRMLRVIKLMKSLPQLQVIMSALVNGFGPIGYASLLLLLFFYFFGVLANLLFAQNDPWRFGTLHFTMATLFQIITLDNWNDVLYTNMYGCDLYGYSYFPWYCTSPNPRFILTILYFTVFIVLGAMVLLSLFIGVVTNSLEEATKQYKIDKEVEEKIKKLALKFSLSDFEIELYRNVFDYIDIDKDHSIEKDEMFFGYREASTNKSIEDMQIMWDRVKTDKTSKVTYLDFSEFLVTMMLLRPDKAVLFESDDGGTGTTALEDRPKKSLWKVVTANALKAGGGGGGGGGQGSSDKADRLSKSDLSPHGKKRNEDINDSSPDDNMNGYTTTNGYEDSPELRAAKILLAHQSSGLRPAISSESAVAVVRTRESNSGGGGNKDRDIIKENGTRPRWLNSHMKLNTEEEPETKVYDM